MDNFKGDFFQYLDFFAPSDSRFSNSCISAKYCPILTNHTSMKALFSFQMMYESQFRKTDPYDWFCGPGSHIAIWARLLEKCASTFSQSSKYVTMCVHTTTNVTYK